MKLPTMALSAGVLIAACSVTTLDDPAGPVPLARGAGGSFTPVVAASSGTPRCVVPSSAPLPVGGRAVALLYPAPGQRQVTVTMDSTGNPIKYLDVRGDLSESNGEVADRTTIGLYLEEGYAVLSNREGSSSPDMLEVPLADALTSPELGNPSEVMEEVLERCGAAD